MSQKKLFLLSVILTALIVAIPTALVLLFDQTLERKADVQKVKVYLTKEKRVVELPLEDYIRGVVASEMPAEFHKEALKAQSLAARTYIVKRLRNNNFSDMEKWGEEAKKAHVTDTVTHQAYHTDEKLKQLWGEKYERKMKAIRAAVQQSEGKIITYKGEPITALFFSTSNGWTENSEDYFGGVYPYLRSVSSIWDQQSPKFLHRTSLQVKEAVKQLEEKTGKKVAIDAFHDGKGMKVLDRTEGKNIAKLQIGDQTFTGREVREALDLHSSDFDWVVKDQVLHIQTKGYGHGVGLSQWGAHLLAQKGKTMEEILTHYYQGVTIEEID